MGTMAERFVSSSAANATGGSQLEVELNMDAVRKHVDDLGKMLTSNNYMRDRIRKIIRAEIKAARNKIASDVHNNLMSDPRKAYRSVRSTIYKQVLGGNINILAPRRAGARYELVRRRTLQDRQWGGNRRPRSPRTEALETYFGKDRGFVLRFNNSGTAERHIKFTLAKRKEDKWNHNPNTGNRGNIAPRGVFSTPALYHLQEIEQAVSEVFEQEFETAWNEL